jgi:hypothetical protein
VPHDPGREPGFFIGGAGEEQSSKGGGGRICVVTEIRKGVDRGLTINGTKTYAKGLYSSVTAK